MDFSSQSKQRWFEKYPKTALSIFIFLSLFAIDMLVANVLIATSLYNPPQKMERAYRIRHDVFHHTLKPSVAGSSAIWGSNTYKVTTNSLGFKDRAIRSITKNPTRYRIIFIGDSFTEGVGIPYKKTFVGLVDNILRKQGVEVLNAGVGSYAPSIYYSKVKYLIEKDKLVFNHLVVYIDISDIEDDALYYRLDENGNVIELERSTPTKNHVMDFLSSNTIIYSNARELIHKIKEKNKLRRLEVKNKHSASIESIHKERSMWTFDDGLFSSYGEIGLRNATRHMDKLSKLLKDKGILLTIAVYPWPDQIAHLDNNSIQVRHWEKWAKKHNANFINHFPDFVGIQPWEETIDQYFIPGDVHWNELGHALIAQRTIKRLKIPRNSGRK